MLKKKTKSFIKKNIFIIRFHQACIVFQFLENFILKKSHFSQDDPNVNNNKKKNVFKNYG